jgi:hypothetical protein
VLEIGRIHVATDVDVACECFTDKGQAGPVRHDAAASETAFGLKWLLSFLEERRRRMAAAFAAARRAESRDQGSREISGSAGIEARSVR